MAVTTFTGFARSLLDDTDAAAMRATLGVYSTTEADTALTNGLNTRQPLDATLTALAGLATGANQLAYSTGTDTFAQTPLTVFARSILDDADAVTVRSTIGADDAANLTTGLLALARLPATLTGKNSSTATALETARTIQGVSFNGTANITLSVVDKDSGTGSAALPAGTSAQRTASPANGMLRYNSETNEFEGYQNGAWAGIGGGTPLYTVLWWPNRASIPAGYIPADGQLLTRTSYQAAFAGVNSGILPVVSDATWLATSTSRGCYTTGNGTTTFRIPDLNGKTAGTTAAPFLRGDGTNSTGIAGNFQASDNLAHTHATTYDTVTDLFAGGGISRTFVQAYDSSNNVATLSSGGVESRPVNVTGVFVIKLIGGASELSQDDASVAVAALDARVSALSNRNRIINGASFIAQRGSGVFSNGLSGYGGPDRFFTINSGGGGQFTQSQGTLVYGGVTKYCVTQTVNSVVTDLSGVKFWGGIQQSIEGLNSYDLLGKPVTVSFLFKASVTGTYSVAVRDAATTANSYITTFAATAGVVTKVIVNVPAIPIGANIPNTQAQGLQVWIGAINSGTYNTATTGAWLSGSFICASTAALWGTTAGANISVTELQLEVGPDATSFEYRNQTQERSMCQRYYQTVTVSARFPATAGSQLISHSIMFPVVMRATPTATLTTSGSIQNLAAASLSAPESLSARFEIQSTSAGDCYALNRGYALDSEI
jgi:hypothetical protein